MNGVFLVFCEKSYVTFKNMLVIMENIWLICEKSYTAKYFTNSEYKHIVVIAM